MTRRPAGSYSDRLKDPRWQRRRLEILEAQGWTCQWCCDTEKTLHVHHRIYLRGKSPWEYEDRDLAVLCEDCHAEIESLRDRLSRAIADLCFWSGDSVLESLIGYVEARIAVGGSSRSIRPSNHEQAIGAGHAIGAHEDDVIDNIVDGNPLREDTLEVFLPDCLHERRRRGHLSDISGVS